MPPKIDKKRTAALQAYYDTLADFAKQYALHEGAVSVAFQTLLADAAKPHHWTLIPQLTDKSIRPDATLKDPMGLVRGHWEAKDTKDDLDAEIAKKTKKGYPLANIIFEDTRRAVLIRNQSGFGSLTRTPASSKSVSPPGQSATWLSVPIRYDVP